jgi:hypothetical protein
MYDDHEQNILQRQMVLIYSISHRKKIFLDTWKIEYMGNTLDGSIKKLEVNIPNVGDTMPLPTS